MTNETLKKFMESADENVQIALDILTENTGDLWDLCEDAGIDMEEAISKAYDVAADAAEGTWDDGCEPGKWGFTVNGKDCAVGYTGVAGEFWQKNGGPTWLPW